MVSNPKLAGLDGLSGLLAEWRGRCAYVVDFVGPRAVPLGNNGDTLLRGVCAKVLSDLGIRLTGRADEADVLLVPPGGALLDRYRAPFLLMRRLARAPDIPLVLLPASSWFVRADPAAMLAGRTAPTLWISREQPSHEHLRTTWGRSLARANVTLALDHDMVVSGHRHVAAMVGDTNTPEALGGALLVARLGAEAGVMPSHPAAPKVGRRLAVTALRRSPASLQRLTRRRTTRDRQLAANGRMLAKIEGRPDLTGGERFSVAHAIDISDPTLASYAEYCRALRTASVVVTDRLHVALPAAILGKPTCLVEAGYHKLAGVYERSLADLPQVRFVERVRR